MKIPVLLASALALGKAMGKTHNVNPAVADLVEALANTEWSKSLKRAWFSTTEDSCNTPLDDWVDQEVNYFHLSESEAEFFEEYEVHLIAFYYKVFLDMNEAQEVIGDNGQYTIELKQRHDLCKNFWETTDPGDELDTHEVLLMGAHGTDLSYDDRLVPTLELVFELSTTKATSVAYRIRSIIETKSMKGYDSPLFTFNAIAAERGSETSRGELVQWPPSIVIGDGMLEALEDFNLHRDGPDFVHSHEFGHHMQYQADIDHDDRCDLDENGEYKRLELMADAFSAYFLAHTLGGQMTSDAIDQLYQTAFIVGDCSGPEEESHGTPDQRECAAMWGAAQAKPPAGSPLQGSDGTVLHPTVLRDRFDSALHHLFDVNQSVCMGLIIPNETIHCDSDDSLDTGIIVEIVVAIVVVACAALGIFYCCRRCGTCKRTPTSPETEAPSQVEVNAGKNGYGREGRTHMLAEI